MRRCARAAHCSPQRTAAHDRPGAGSSRFRAAIRMPATLVNPLLHHPPTTIYTLYAISDLRPIATAACFSAHSMGQADGRGCRLPAACTAKQPATHTTRPRQRASDQVLNVLPSGAYVL